MIKIRQIDKVRGLEGAIYGMRLAMLSGDKSDSVFYDQWSGEYHDIMGNFGPYDTDRISEEWDIGLDDLSLMRKLGKSGSEHAKYRRAIVTWVDVKAPLYWWKEADTYKVGTVRLSSSTMHKIHAKEFTLDDFSREHLIKFPENVTEDDLIKKEYRDQFCAIAVNVSEYSTLTTPYGVLEEIVASLNLARRLYLETKDKRYWWQMIQLLPSSYNQETVLVLNYETLAKMYRERKNHKLDEWHAFCDWIKTLPYAKEIITMEEKTNA